MIARTELLLAVLCVFASLATIGARAASLANIGLYVHHGAADLAGSASGIGTTRRLTALAHGLWAASQFEVSRRQAAKTHVP